MFSRWLLAALHLAALGIGFAAIWTRATSLRDLARAPNYRRLFAADAVWGLAAILWIGTGLLRAFGGFEKGSDYYLQNHLFWTKMALLGGVLLLELKPMTTLIRWRINQRGGGALDLSAASTLARISYAQAALILAMVLAATAMARGFG